MKNRIRLIVLAASLFTLAGVSHGEAAEASPCTDACYWRYYSCFYDPYPYGSYCRSDYLECVNACPPEE